MHYARVSLGHRMYTALELQPVDVLLLPLMVQHMCNWCLETKRQARLSQQLK